MGRWKLGPQGAYYDPNDTGPDQVAPPGGAPQLAAIAGVLGGRPGEGPGRWKVGRNGQPEWEAGVTAPNQIPPPPMLEHAPGWPVPGQGGGSPGQFPTDAAGVPQIPGEVSPLGAPPPGFDATKRANPEHQTAKNRGGRALAAGQSLEDVAKMLGGEVLGNDRLRWTNPETGQQETVDVLFDQEGIRRPQWNVEGPGGATGAAGGGDLAAGGTGAGGEDWFGANAPGGTPGGGGGAAAGQPGSLLAPWTQSFDFPYFEPPTEDEVFEDPGVRFRMSEANKGLQRSAAARGTLFTGGTLKSLMGLNQDLARQEYGNVYNRRRGEWGTAYDKAMGEYGLGRDIFQANQDRPFNKLASIAGLGQVAGSQLGALGQQYANLFARTATGGAGAQGDYWTQGANARAAGQVGRANAWNPVYNLPWMWGA